MVDPVYGGEGGGVGLGLAEFVTTLWWFHSTSFKQHQRKFLPLHQFHCESKVIFSIFFKDWLALVVSVVSSQGHWFQPGSSLILGFFFFRHGNPSHLSQVVSCCYRRYSSKLATRGGHLLDRRFFSLWQDVEENWLAISTAPPKMKIQFELQVLKNWNITDVLFHFVVHFFLET